MALLGIAAVAAVLWARPGSSPGLPFTGAVERPLFPNGGPAVLIDDAHWNHGVPAGRLRAFTDLLTLNGYVVLPSGNATRAEMLVDAKIAVVVNPLGVLGVSRRLAHRVGLGDIALVDDDALLTQEIETTYQWIENGGSMLVAMDESPFARGSRGLVGRFGIRLHDDLVVDLGHSDGDPSRLVFSRENRLLGRHPIVDGFADAPPVNRVVTFGGTALESPLGAVALLRLSASASAVGGAGEPTTTGRSVGGLAQAVALERGRGRLVVLADSHVLTVDPGEGGRATGLGWSDSNNERFVRYIMRWLARRD